MNISLLSVFPIFITQLFSSEEDKEEEKEEQKSYLGGFFYAFGIPCSTKKYQNPR
jgi:hypothetical protein